MTFQSCELKISSVDWGTSGVLHVRIYGRRIWCNSFEEITEDGEGDYFVLGVSSCMLYFVLQNLHSIYSRLQAEETFCHFS